MQKSSTEAIVMQNLAQVLFLDSLLTSQYMQIKAQAWLCSGYFLHALFEAVARVFIAKQVPACEFLAHNNGQLPVNYHVTTVIRPILGACSVELARL